MKRLILERYPEAAQLPKLDVKYVVVSSANRIPMLQNGTIDIECGSTTNNAVRQQQVAFALTTYAEEICIAVKAGSGIQSIGQLEGRKVAQGRSRFGTEHRQHAAKHDGKRRDRAALRQVVLEADCASANIRQSAGVQGDQSGLGEPERQARGRVRSALMRNC